MQIKPSLGLVVGPVNASHWSQVLTTPSAYGIVEVMDATGHAQEHGVQVLSQLGEGLNSEISSLRDLEAICDAVEQEYVRTLIVLVPIEHIIYLVLRGKGIVYIKRGKELASLMHQDGALSGEVRPNDTVLLASEGFSGVLTREELSTLFDHLPAPEIAEKLTLLLHEKSDGDGSVALVFGVSDVSEEKNSTPEIPVQEHEPPQPPIEKPKKIKRNILKQIKESIRSNPKRSIAIIAICCTVFFVVSVILGVAKQTSVKKNQKIIALIGEAQRALDEGVALIDLNPAKGRERLESAKMLLEPLKETVSTRTIEGRKVLEVYQSITDNLTQALHITQVSPLLFYDVSLVKKDGVVHALARDGDSLLLSDAATNTIYRMDVPSKNTQIIGGGVDVKGPMKITTHGTSTYVLVDSGILEIQSTAKKPSLVIPKDSEWGTIQSIVSFGGNIYLLDVIKSRIWKYVATELKTSAGGHGFSERREYLNPDTLPDLTRTSGMAIDGSIFLGNADGSIIRFTQGKENTFVPKGVDPAFGASPIVYASDDATFIYVLDSKYSRIVVLDKDGMYVSQYQYTGDSPSSFVVFEKLKKIMLLVKGKLYTIDLK